MAVGWIKGGVTKQRAPIYIEIICVLLIGTLSSLKILSQRESFKEIDWSTTTAKNKLAPSYVGQSTPMLRHTVR